MRGNMSAGTLSEQQSRSMERVLKAALADSGADAMAVCDMSGNVLAQQDRDGGRSLGNAAALAAGAWAATRALAELLDESAFRSIAYRGQKSGVMVHAIGKEHFILVITGQDAIEGMVRLLVRRAVRQISGILEGARDQTAEQGSEGVRFEVEERPDTGS